MAAPTKFRRRDAAGRFISSREDDYSNCQTAKQTATEHQKPVKGRGRSKSQAPATHPPLHVAEGKPNALIRMIHRAQNLDAATVKFFEQVLAWVSFIGLLVPLLLVSKLPSPCLRAGDIRSVSADLDGYVAEITARMSFYEELESMDAFFATHDNVAYSLLEQRLAINKLDLDAPTQVTLLGKIDANLAAADDVAATLKALEADIALVSAVPHECLKSANSLEELQRYGNMSLSVFTKDSHQRFVEITLSGFDIVDQTLLRPLQRLEYCLESLERAENSTQDLTKTMQKIRNEVDLTRDQMGFWARTPFSDSSQFLHDLESNLYTVIPAWQGVQDYLLTIQQELQAYQQATSGFPTLLKLGMKDICNLTSLDVVPKSFRAIPNNSSYPSLGNYVNGSWDRKPKQHLKPNDEKTVWPTGPQRTPPVALRPFLWQKD